MFYSSKWGQKLKIWVSYWWSCISLFVHVFSVKCIRSPTIHSSTYKHSPTYNLQCENWNKINALINVSKEETHHESDDFKSNQFKRIHVLTSFCLASDPQRKTLVSRAGQFEKDRIRASQCSGRNFLLHLPSRSDRCGRQSSI